MAAKLHEGMTTDSPKAADASTKPCCTTSVNEKPTRTAVPKVTTPGPRTA